MNSLSLNIVNPISMVTVLVFPIFAGFIVTKAQHSGLLNLVLLDQSDVLVDSFDCPNSICCLQKTELITADLKMGEYYLKLYGFQAES